MSDIIKIRHEAVSTISDCFCSFIENCMNENSYTTRHVIVYYSKILRLPFLEEKMSFYSECNLFAHTDALSVDAF